MAVSQDQAVFPQGGWLAWAVKLRQPVSLLVGAVCAVLLFTLPSSWPANGVIFLCMEVLAFALVVVAVLGRIWCSVYIGGFKEDKVVAQGPYSLIRNPLYVFSFLGALGLGLATRHGLIVMVIGGFFIFYYPLVVLAEEKILVRKFGQDYLVYAKHTPRFLPRRLTPVEPEFCVGSPLHVRRAMQETVWFFVLYGILHLLSVF